MEIISWSKNDFNDNTKKLMLTMSSVAGYQAQDETLVTCSVFIVDQFAVCFESEEGKYWSHLFVEYACRCDAIFSLQLLKDEARKFFVGLWGKNHGGLVEALEKASFVAIVLDGRTYTFQ